MVNKYRSASTSTYTHTQTCSVSSGKITLENCSCCVPSKNKTFALWNTAQSSQFYCNTTRSEMDLPRCFWLSPNFHWCRESSCPWDRHPAQWVVHVGCAAKLHIYFLQITIRKLTSTKINSCSKGRLNRVRPASVFAGLCTLLSPARKRSPLLLFI